MTKGKRYYGADADQYDLHVCAWLIAKSFKEKPEAWLRPFSVSGEQTTTFSKVHA